MLFRRIREERPSERGSSARDPTERKKTPEGLVPSGAFFGINPATPTLALLVLPSALKA